MNRRDRKLPCPRCLLAALIATAVLASCSSAPNIDDVIAPTTDSRRAIAAKALEALGAPYRAGAGGPDAFDDSGYVYYAYHGAGAKLPRDRQAQLDTGKPIALAAAKPADLLFFRVEDNTGSDRLVVGLFTQAGEMLMASPGFTGDSGVGLFDTDDAFWRQRLIGVVRQLP